MAIVHGTVKPDGTLEIADRLSLPPGPVQVSVLPMDFTPSEPVLPPNIINRGRGPEIAGTRITVYDVLDYHKENWPAAAIAAWFDLWPEQIECAIAYIEEHKDEVLANYQKILEREARGNPPELQAKLDTISAEAQAHWAELRRQGKLPRREDEGNPGGR